MGLLGILVGLSLLIHLVFRGSSILILAPVAGLIVAAFAGEPLLASRTQTFMRNAADFVAQFFRLFLLGAQRAILAVVLAGAIVTYGGVSLFVAFLVLVPMAVELFRSAGVPRRLMPAAVALGTTTFTMSALPGTPSINTAIPMPFFGTMPFAAPGLVGEADRMTARRRGGRGCRSSA